MYCEAIYLFSKSNLSRQNLGTLFDISRPKPHSSLGLVRYANENHCEYRFLQLSHYFREMRPNNQRTNASYFKFNVLSPFLHFMCANSYLSLFRVLLAMVL
jgi:hypothetical protein